MDVFAQLDADADGDPHVLWTDGERVFYRGSGLDAKGARCAVLAVAAASHHPTPASLERLAREYELRDELDAAWAVRPLALGHDRGQTMLLLHDPGGQPLEQLLGRPMEIGRFLPLAIGVAAALGRAHQSGLVHKDIKPANIFVNDATGAVRLTGFGIASRVPRERQAPDPPEIIAGSLAYMAPEQTGRMNRSIDARSDLYALGVTLYQMITGSLPFTAADPMAWIHCHIARMPIPPSDRLATIPAPVSAIVMKLLAKTAEERYQTAGGVERDLRRCLAEWRASASIADFPLGQQDTPDRLLIPEKLYGREREIEFLLAAFDRVVADGGPALMLVSGYAGIGKSSVVQELHRALVPSRGLFASGKFDQYQRDIPYATLAQALQGLVRSLLGKSEADLTPWREALREVLGPNGQLMVSLIPELELIIGPQPPAPELGLQDAQRRFQMVFRRLLGVFASAEHPLVLFLDDLQWLDAATLDLLEHLATQPELPDLLLVGAYRNNEVTPTHPLMRRLAAVREAGGRVQEIFLTPLRLEDVGRLLADALHCASERVAPLARLVHEKTGGNPFFTIQFLTALAEEGLLVFRHDLGRWVWDEEPIRAKGFTDNVVELMIGKLRRLPAETQEALKRLACLGAAAAVDALSLVHEATEAALQTALWEAVRAGLVFRQKRSYRFLHDRVQEAAYALIPEGERVAEHLRIGRLLETILPPERREEAIFEIVNQLNRGAPLITLRDEREELAELNLIAGKRARASAAYTSALTYLEAGAAQLAEDAWERRQGLAFALELRRAECEFWTGAPEDAEQRLAALAMRAVDMVQRAAVASLRADLYTSLGVSDRAVAVALDCLRHGGIDWPVHPTEVEARREYERIWRQLGSREIEDIVGLPLMRDPESLATLDVLTTLGAPALYTDRNLYALTIGRAVNLSLEHGNSDAAPAHYATLGLIASDRFGDYDAGYRFGKLALDLVDRGGLKRFSGRTYMVFQVLVPWTRPFREAIDPARRGFQMANEDGDLTFAAFCCSSLVGNLLAAGNPLAAVEREAEHGLEFTRGVPFVSALISLNLGVVRTLRGHTSQFGCLDHGAFTERSFEERVTGRPALALTECCYWIRKLQARFLAGDYAAAMVVTEATERWLPTSAALSVFLVERADYHLYAALAHAAACEPMGPDPKEKHLKALDAHHRRLLEWAAHSLANFEPGAALVAAEIARLEGRVLDAQHLYEQAIRSARANGLVHQEALANELAGRFYTTQGFETIAQAYLREALRCYLSWGADGKVRQLEGLYPRLRTDEAANPSSTIGAPVEHLDLATVITVSQAVSGEMVLEKLLDTLLRTALAQAGAERGLLLLLDGTEPRIVAEATTRGETVDVRLGDEVAAPNTLPESVLRYVLRSRESVVLDDASGENPFSGDPYIRQQHARSVLGLPLLNRAKLIGALYLENDLAPGVFAPARIPVLKLLASQAAISLENTRLYSDLAEREAKIRRLVDANIIGIFLWDLDGRILEANDAFLRMVGYAREDIAARHLSWLDLTPAEWLERDAQRFGPDLKRTGSLQPHEREYIRRDGARIPVLIGAASFEDAGTQGVAFVLDLTDLKRAEAEAGENERLLRETQAELAHANRVATTGHLTASIAHEVNQPITASITNAAAATRWLSADPPNIDEARLALGRIAQSARRASEIIQGMRALAKKAPPRTDSVAINEAVAEIVAITRSEADKNKVSVSTRFADDLPLIEADRVQLQQVVLNLMVNAIEAMGDADGARELQITTARAASDGVVIAVEDTGPGLPPETLARLFDPFYTTKATGLGLGLSICRSIVEAHDGRLSATSNAPNGARFEFTLPARPGS